MALFMETTTVDDVTTVSTIQHLLAVRGASSVSVEYMGGKVEGLTFSLIVCGAAIPFKLPCRWQAIEKILKGKGRRPRKNDTWESWSRRVAWRQILRWVEAQLALIETGMVKQEEVFLPYALVGNQTMFQFVEERKFLSLPAPKENEGTPE